MQKRVKLRIHFIHTYFLFKEMFVTIYHIFIEYSTFLVTLDIQLSTTTVFVIYHKQPYNFIQNLLVLT